jgi:acetyltransferase-like isoleucine patch superfamily enzyme/acyl carrier protein
MLEIERDQSARRALRRLGTATSHGLARLALHGVDHLGARARVHGRPFVENLGRITIGDDLELHAAPVRSHLVTGASGVLTIGDGVTIGAGAAIAAEARVEIGCGVHLEPFVMLLDSDYHATSDRSAPGLSAPIVVGAHAWLGERVTVLRGATIGRFARVEPGSVVSGVIPEGALAAGVPALVIRRGEASPVGGAPGDLTARIQRLCAEVFALPEPPDPTQGPAQIRGWDSLGALRLLVTLEDELGISLPESALADVRDLAGLCEIVAGRLGGRSASRDDEARRA